MPKGSPELTQARKDEIIDACESLYRSHSFKEITVDMIAKDTTFTRASIYNYFKNKEEIFLALLQREYAAWNESLESILEGPTLDAADFAETLAASLDDRGQLLKLLSMNHYDMEASSRTENLIEFKYEYGRSLTLVRECLNRFFPSMTDAEKRDFVYTFFPEMFGIYAYTVVTEKQQAAMSEAGVSHVYQLAHDLVKHSVCRLLGVPD